MGMDQKDGRKGIRGKSLLAFQKTKIEYIYIYIQEILSCVYFLPESHSSVPDVILSSWREYLFLNLPPSIQFSVLLFKQLAHSEEAPETLINALYFPNNLVPLNQGII